jgi:universal stress protein E
VPVPLLLVKDRKLARAERARGVDPSTSTTSRLRSTSASTRSRPSSAHPARPFARRVLVRTPLGAELPPDVVKLIADEHRAAMRRFLDTHAALEGRPHLYEGAAHECLQQAAKQHAADFVVMGAVARRGLKRLFIGSTAERVLDRLSCDLVIIKPLEFEVPQAD